MKPIPRNLLIHSASLSDVVLGDYNTEETIDTVALNYVRVEPDNSAVTAKDNRTLTASYRLFFDCVNSTPAGTTFGIDQRITFSGETFKIADAQPYYDESKLHHWELILCR